MKSLTVAKLRIYIDEVGAALFDPATESRAAIETKIRQYGDFIEAWLDASEENRPRRVSEEELDLRKDLTALAKYMKRLGFKKSAIESVLVDGVVIIGKGNPRLTQRQLSESVTEVISLL